MAGFNLNDSIDDEELAAIKRGATGVPVPPRVTTNNNPYFNSPMDPLEGQDDLLTSIINGQQPLYDYGMSPEDNVIADSPLALNFPANNATVQQEPTQSLAASAQPIVAPAPKIASDPVTITKQYEDKVVPFQDVDDLATMQQEARRNSAMVSVLEGLTDAGKSVASAGRINHPAAKYDDLRNLAAQPVKDREALIKDNEDKAKRDPNSELSKVTRSSITDALNRMGRRQLADTINSKGLSAKQLEDAFGQYNLSNMMSSFEAAEARKAQAKMMAEARRDSKEASSDNRKTNQELALNKRVDQLDKDLGVSEAVDAMNTLKEYQFQKTDPAMDIATLYKFIKVLDPGSAVKEGEISLTRQGQSMLGNLGLNVKKITSGAIITPELRSNIINTIDKIKNQRIKTFKNKTSGIMNAAKKHKLDPNIIFGDSVEYLNGANIGDMDVSDLSDEELRAEADRLGIK